MVQIYGTVEHGPNPMATSENCLKNCYENSDCFLAWIPKNGSCYSYSFYSNTVSVKATAKEDGSVVWFKISLPIETCPSLQSDVNLTLESSMGNTYSWEKTENGYSFNGCRDGWKRFERNNGITVCMNAFNSPKLERATAQTWCSRKNATIIGMASVEESQWVHGHLESNNTWYAYWVDGTLTCKLNTCDYSTLKYSDGFTTGSAALNTTTNFFINPAGSTNKLMYLAVTTLHDYKPKTIYNPGGKNPADGVVCGYQLKN